MQLKFLQILRAFFTFNCTYTSVVTNYVILLENPVCSPMRKSCSFMTQGSVKSCMCAARIMAQIMGGK